MNTTTRLRRHTLARLSAISLVVLIVLPFTAPFATYDLARGHSDHQLFKDKDDSNAVVLSAPTLATPPWQSPQTVVLDICPVPVPRLLLYDLVLRV